LVDSAFIVEVTPGGLGRPKEGLLVGHWEVCLPRHSPRQIHFNHYKIYSIQRFTNKR